MSEPALKVEHVGHRFGERVALDDVSFEAAKGKVTALLGINGAGKSTLFNIVSYLYANRTGEVSICGHDLRRTPRAALASLGIVFQSRALDADLSVAQNFVYKAALQGIGRRTALARAEELLAQVGMSDAIKRKVATLSGGQARRVEIASALVHSPRLLLCDEPTVGLDVQARRGIVDHVHHLAAEQGVGIVWATHLIDEIAPDDPVVVLHEGKVLATADAREIAGEGGDLSTAFLKLTGSGAAS